MPATVILNILPLTEKIEKRKKNLSLKKEGKENPQDIIINTKCDCS